MAAGRRRPQAPGHVPAEPPPARAARVRCRRPACRRGARGSSAGERPAITWGHDGWERRAVSTSARWVWGDTPPVERSSALGPIRASLLAVGDEAEDARGGLGPNEAVKTAWGLIDAAPVRAFLFRVVPQDFVLEGVNALAR